MKGCENVSEELLHYGIKGMRWGVRRYQNFDGSYTKRGVERYKKAEEAYESAKATRRAVRKSPTASRQDKRSASTDVKNRRKELEKAYSKLKYDKLADQGKELYKQGKTITGNAKAASVRQTAVIVGSIAVGNILASSGKLNLAIRSRAAIAIGGTAVNAILSGKTAYENKRLRAYYAH